jgi:hypothetical protein
MITTKIILIIPNHLICPLAPNPQSPAPSPPIKSPKQPPQHDINLRIRQRHPHTHPAPLPEGNHIAIQRVRLLGTLQPAFGGELHGFGEDGGFAVHLPGRGADYGAGGEEVGVESRAGRGHDAREAADDAEGEAEGFFYYGGLCGGRWLVFFPSRKGRERVGRTGGPMCSGPR